METASTIVLMVLGLTAYNNYRRGQLGAWFKAKFLNAASPTPAKYQFSAAPVATGAMFAGDAAGAAIGTGATSTSPGAAAGAAAGAGAGGWTKPLDAYTVTQHYGGASGHPGIDLAAPLGTPIHAARPGTVIAAGPNGGYGNAVDIDHGAGITTRYGHMSQVNVRVGQQVAAGQIIGLVGSTGYSTGPHLHFEIRQNGQTTDPGPQIGIS